MRVAVLRCHNLPSFVTWELPNREDLFTDDRLLIEAFAERGAAAEPVVWDDPGVDWNQFDLALLRSTWDYIDAPERFLAVLAAIEASRCRLFNSLAAARWNSDKAYLFDLRDWGVPIVPTQRASAVDPAGLQAEYTEHGWRGAVLKPAVGAGAADVRRVPAWEVAAAVGRLAEQGLQDAFLVQPLVESVVSEGEWSYIFIDGHLSHVLLKRPAPGDYRAHGIYGGTVALAEPRPGDTPQVEAMLARLPYDLLYARLDLVRMDGRLTVMELELIEPMLYLDRAPGSAGRLAEAALARLASE